MSRSVLEKLVHGRDLTGEEAKGLMTAIMSGELNDMQIAGVLVALRAKGETVDEIAGFVSAMREKAVGIPTTRTGLIDTCGTGGDGRHTFNISTATAFVAAGMGIPIAKHGNRAVSSSCGSADVLEELGIDIALPPEAVGTLVDDVGIGFLFAPAHHPATKYAMPARRGLGIRTVFNLLGPMTNPAGVKRQLIGVFDASLTETVARVLAALGSEKVFVAHGLDGADEITLTAETQISALENGEVRTFTFTPEEAGFERVTAKEIGGGDAKENAGHIRAILDGEKSARRDAVVLNAAFAAMVADKAASVDEGVALATRAIDDGSARGVLDALVARSRELSA